MNVNKTFRPDKYALFYLLLASFDTDTVTLVAYLVPALLSETSAPPLLSVDLPSFLFFCLWICLF